MSCCHYRGCREKLLPLQLKHTKNSFNVKYIPLNQITGYHCSSANNVQIILSQFIAVRHIEATGLILLKQWNKKLLAKQIIGKIFQLPVQPGSAPLMGKGKQHTVLQRGNDRYRDLIARTNRQEEMLFQLRQQRKWD